MPISAPPNRKSGPPIITGDITIGAFDNEAEAAVSVDDLPDQTVLGNDSGSVGPATPITVHQELDWIGGTQAWIFDGVDDRINFGNVLAKERTDSFSVSWWFSTTSTSDQSMVTKNSAGPAFQGWQVAVAGGGTPQFQLSNGVGNRLYVGASSTLVVDGQIHHCVVTYNGTSAPGGVVIYVDGSSVATTTIQNTLTATTANTADLLIGMLPGPTNPTEGVIKHVSVWSGVLTAAEVLEAYNNGNPPDLEATSMAADLQWWVKLDEADATGAGNVIDHSASSFDGTAEGSLAPTSNIGALPVRGSDVWQLIPPGASGLPLVSNGAGSIPSYRELLSALTVVNPISGTHNAYAIPTTVKHRDFLAWVSGGATVTLNGIDATNVPEGFEFTLNLSANTFVDINSESASATATNRISLPGAVTMSLISGCSLTFRRASTRWGVISIGYPDASTSIVYSGNRQLQRAALTGAITASQNSNTTAFGSAAANTVLINPTAGSAVPAFTSIGANTVLGRQGGNIVAAQVATNQIANDAVTYAKIQNVVNNNRFLGRISGAGGDVEELTGTQSTTLLDTFTSGLKGLAPASGGGTTNFLRADGSWAAPALSANATEINNSTATGNLGTIDISSLTCGGTYRVSAASAGFSIEGFTAKTAGFWFMFEVEDTDLCVLFHEDATATATNRLDLPGSIDVSAIKPRGIFFYTGSRWRYVSSGNPNVLGSGSDLVQVTQGGGNVVNITTGAGDVNISPGGTGSVVMTSAATIGVEMTAPSVLIQSSGGGGFLRFVESATSAPAVSAGQGMYWVKNSSPPQPMYTDENEDDWPLLGQGVAGMDSLFTVTNSTTALSLTESFVIPSDSCQPGTTYKLTAHFKFVRGATATAMSMRAGGFVNGVERGTTGNVSTKTAAAAYLGEMTGILTIESIGAGGTAFLSIRCNNTYNASGAAGSDAYLDGTNGGAAIANFAFNTTVSNSIELRAQMQTAVSGCSLIREGGFVERVRY